MSAINLPGNITFSRPRGINEGKINIRIRDKISRISFVEVSIPLSEFTEALFGLAEVDCSLRCAGLENVGKKRVTEDHNVDCPIEGWKSEEVKEWVIEYFAESSFPKEGWSLAMNFDSRGAIKARTDGMKGCTVCFSVYRYIDLAL